MFEIIPPIIALTIFSTAMLAVLIVGRRIIIVQRFAHINLVDLVFYFALFKVIAYYVVPIIFNIFSNFRYVKEDGVALLSLVYIYGIEVISWLAWLAGLIAVALWFKDRAFLRSDCSIDQNKDVIAKWSLTLLSVGFVHLRATSLIDVLNDSSSFSWYLEIIKSILVYAGPPAGIVLLVIGFKRWGFWFGMLGLASSALGIALVSTRGALVYSIVFLVYLLFVFSISRKVKLQLIIGVSFLSAVYFIFGGLPAAEISIDNNNNISIEAGVGTEKKGDRTSIEEIEWRFGALSRMSTKFIDMYDRGDGAGINPIKNSFLGFLPRALNPGKPHPSTVDGNDIYSQGMYLIYREIYGYDTYSMVEFSSGGHAYWEFGWLGVIVLSAISGVYIGLCMYYFQSLGLLSIPLLVATFKPWGYVDPKIWVSDIVIQLYQLIIPLMLILFICKIMVAVRNLFVGGINSQSNSLPPAAVYGLPETQTTGTVSRHWDAIHHD